MPYAHFYTVEFRILGRELDPARITRELGLQPSQIRVPGTLRADGRSLDAMWAYHGADTDHPLEWGSLEQGLSHVLEKLWPHRETIRLYGARAELIWWCGHYQSSFD